MFSSITAKSQVLFALQAVTLLLFIVMIVAQAEDSAIITSIESQLEFDEHQKLSSYHFVYPATQNPACVAKIFQNEDNREADAYFGQHGLQGEALRRVFPDYGRGEERSSSRCLAACLEKGTDRSVAGYTLPSFHYDSPPSNEKNILSWFRKSCQMVEVCLLQYVSKTEPLSIYWIDRSKDKSSSRWIKQFDLEHGENNARCFHASLGHQFVAIQETETTEIDPELGQKDLPQFEERIVIDHTMTKAFGTRPNLSVSIPSHQFYDENEEKKIDLEEVIKTLEEVKLELEEIKNALEERNGLGFVKKEELLLPNDVLASMGSFRYNNQNDIVQEQHQMDEDSLEGSVMRGSETNSAEVVLPMIPSKLKEAWETRWRNIESEWHDLVFFDGSGSEETPSQDSDMLQIQNLTSSAAAAAENHPNVEYLIISPIKEEQSRNVLKIKERTNFIAATAAHNYTINTSPVKNEDVRDQQLDDLRTPLSPMGLVQHISS